MSENEKAGAYAPAFCVCEKSFCGMRLCGYGKMGRKAARKGYCHPGCSLLEKVFQRFALQSVQPDIFLVIFAKSLWGKEQDVFRFERAKNIL